MTAMKYFEINDASNPVKLGTFTFEFHRVEFYQGKWWGILQVDDEGAINALTGKAGRRAGIRAMTEDDYRKASKKKMSEPSGISLIRSKPLPPPKPEAPTGRVVADNGKREIEVEVAPVGDTVLADILTPKDEQGKAVSPESEPQEAPQPLPPLESMTDEQLREQLTKLDIDFHHKTGTKKLRAKLEAARAE